MQLKWQVWIFSIVTFLFTLYLVELGPWGSAKVGEYNDGYGTFDMKNYNADDVKRVLSQMAPEGFMQSYHYYISDTIFLIFFGLLQVLISLAIYHRQGAKGVYLVLAVLALTIPILRGIFDLIENGLLFYTMKSYPDLNTRLITIASIATKCKLLCIRVWVVLSGIGILYNVIKK